MSMINESLLDALLSRFSTRDRYNAEIFYQSVAVEERVVALMNILLNMQSFDEGRSLLSAVLLRRDVSKLGALSLKSDDLKRSNISLLQNLLDSTLKLMPPLCQQSFQLQLVYLLSEISSSIDFIDPSLGQWTIKQLLENFMRLEMNGIHPKIALRLISAIAQQCPISMWQSVEFDFMERFFRTLAASLIEDKNHAGYTIQSTIESYFEAFFYTCIASDISSVFQTRTIGADNAEDIFLQRIFLQTELRYTSLRNWCDDNSVSSRLGQAIIPLMLNLLMKHRKDGDLIQKCMGHMGNCTSTSPTTYSGDVHHLSRMLEYCCMLSTEFSSVKDTISCLAVLDFIEGLLDIDHVKKTLTSCREFVTDCICGGSTFQGLLKICVDTILSGLDYDDIEGWAQVISPVHEQSSDDYWDGDEIAYRGQGLLESFLRSANMNAQSLTNFLNLLEASLFIKESHQCKETALRIFQACTLAVPDLFKPLFSVALNFVIFHATTPNYRLQYQCAHFIAVACESQMSDIEAQHAHGSKIIQCLQNLLRSPCDKVVAKTCSALVTCCRVLYDNDCSDHSFSHHLIHEAVSALISGPLHNEGNTIILTHAISAVAALAGLSSVDFVPMYHQMMPGLLSCASININEDHLKSDVSVSNAWTLRNTAIEAASIIILSVSMESTQVPRLETDAASIMNIITICLEKRRGQHEPDDQILLASSRIARVLEEKFLRYLPSIVPYIALILSESVHVSVTDGNENPKQQGSEIDEETGLESITIAVPGLGNKKISLNTYQIQEKISVTTALRDHANALGRHFGPYALEFIPTLQSLIRFQYSAQARACVAGCLSALFTSLCEHSYSFDSDQLETNVSVLLNEITLNLAHQLTLENDDDFITMSELAESISDICYSAYGYYREGHAKAILDDTTAHEVVVSLVRTIQKCLRYRNIASTIEGDEIQSGESLVTSSVDSIGYILKSYGPRFLSIFEELIHPFFSPFMKAAESVDVLARHAAVCLYDDCVEHCGNVAASIYSPLLLGAAMVGIDDNSNGGNIALKQASIYGIIQIARFSPKSLLSCDVTGLMNVILDVAMLGKDKGKEAIENIRLVENAASAVASLCLCSDSPFKSLSAFDQTTILDAFLYNLPLQEDEDEAKICHKIFVDMIKEGAMMNRIPLIIKIAGKLGSFLDEGGEAATEETLHEFSGILKQMKSRVAPQLINQSLAKLSSDEYNGFISIMSNY